MSTELIEKVDEILNKSELPDRHTFFQIEKFLIGKEPTGQSQLWQIVRELKARKETVDSYTKQLEDSEDEMELFDIQIQKCERELRKLSKVTENAEELNVDLRILEYEINIRKAQREKEQLVKAAKKVKQKLKNVMEEMSYLTHGFERVSAVVGEMKPLDDDVSQREYWNEKLLEEFNLRVLFNKPIDPEFVKTVLALDDDSPIKNHLVGMINKIQNKMLEEKNIMEESKIETKG